MPKKVMVVSGDESAVSVLERTLGRQGHMVIIESDSVAALERASRERPNLVIVDKDIEPLSPRELCGALQAREEMKLVPTILMFSSKEYPEGMSLMQKVGVDDYILKPINVIEVTDKLGIAMSLGQGAGGFDKTTGLPDARAFEAEVTGRISETRPMTVCLLRIRNFRPFIRVYGEGAATKPYAVLKEIFSDIAANYSVADLSFAKLTNDTFGMVCDADFAERLSEEIIGLFDNRIYICYSDRDLAKGYVVVVDQHDTKHRYALMCLNIVGTSSKNRELLDYPAIRNRCEAMADELLGVAGSCYVID